MAWGAITGLRWLVLLAAPAALAAADAVVPPVQASGVFINMRGDVLTARHAVTDCRTVYVVKNTRVVVASVLALSNAADLAVLQTSLKPLLAATLSEQGAPAGHSIAVFSEAYALLQALPERGRVLANALTVPGHPGELQMVSGSRPGASGSAVLDEGGLLLGLVAERVAAGSGGGVAAMQPGAPRAGMATQVRAVPVEEIRQFLQQVDVPYTQSRRAQIGTLQSPASRASTLAVGILCG